MEDENEEGFEVLQDEDEADENGEDQELENDEASEGVRLDEDEDSEHHKRSEDNTLNKRNEEDEEEEESENKNDVEMTNNIDNSSVLNGPTSSSNTNITQELRVQKFDAALRDLEGDEIHLGKLLEMKEREWDNILKLKKLREIKIARMKRKKDLGDMFGVHNTHESIRNHKLVGSIRLTEMRKNIRIFEKEIQELVEEMFAENQVVPLPESDDPKSELSSAEDSYLASTALKNLAKHQNRSLIAPNIHSSSGGGGGGVSSRVIGEGRRGLKVEVASLIADYRLKSQEDKEIRRPSSTTPLPILDPLDLAPEMSYTDLLSHTKTLFEREKKLNICNATNTSNTKMVLGSSSKGKGSSISSVTSNNLSVGTTLAKLLSSNNGNSSCRAVDEAVSYNHNKPSSNNSAGSEKNLSLANLLASSKSRDEQPQTSTKKKATTTDTPITPSVMCQGCHANKAQFVCAGCANQWYCSRECQVAAWDDHSDICSG